MANQTQPDPQIPKKKKLFDREALVTIAALVILGGALAGWLLYNNHQNNQKATETLAADKARFAQLEKDMSAAYEQMVAGAEKPLSDQKDRKTCDRTSQKFEKGDLYCSVSYGTAYKVANYDAALERLSVLVHTFDQNETFKPDIGKLDETLADRSSVGYEQETDAEVPLKVEGTFSCNIYMKIDKSSEAMAVAETEGRLATYAFSCLDNVHQEIYPLAK